MKNLAVDKDVLFIVVDLFCGAGGTTTGFEDAIINGKRIVKVIACVNHDKNAILSHKANHPHAHHFVEDIRKFKPSRLTALINAAKKKYPNAKVILWASLECTNFSKAKGGLPRDADSRTLANYLLKYLKCYKYDSVQIENVTEFLDWGPLTKKGKPIKSKKGTYFKKWCKNMCSYGYNQTWHTMNAADYGARQTRNRLFGIFSSGSVPMVFPDTTHAKNPTRVLKLSGHKKKKWLAVRPLLDLKEEGESIFFRKKPLVENSLRRLYAGLMKYVAGGESAFIAKYYSGGSGDGVKSQISGLNDPCGSIMNVDKNRLVNAQFLKKYYTTSGFVQSIDEPSGTIRTKDGMALVSTNWLDISYSGDKNHKSVDGPSGAIMPNDKHNIVKCWIMATDFNNIGSSVEKPFPTVTASRHAHYLINPQWSGNNICPAKSIDTPSPSIIARQDKAPLYLIACKEGRTCIPIFEGDSDILIKIKEFMVLYDIMDIKMRMLRIDELLKIQGFKGTYQLIGTKAEQKKYIGNAVHTIIPKKWAECMGKTLLTMKQKLPQAA